MMRRELANLLEKEKVQEFQHRKESCERKLKDPEWPSCPKIHPQGFEGIFSLWNFPHLFIIYICLSREVCWEDVLVAECFGKEGTEQEKGMQWALEVHRHIIEILTFLTTPGFPSAPAPCQGRDYQTPASVLPAAQQQLLYNPWIPFFHCITMAPGQIFLEGGASREREAQLLDSD